MSSHQLSRGQLAAKALIRLLISFIILIALLFLPAGSVLYWEAWGYLCVLFIPIMFALVYLLVNHPQLLERRMRMREKTAEQKLIVKTGTLFYILTFLCSGLDFRFGWSHVPAAAVVAADVLILLSYGLFVLVLRENPYASRIIEVESDQHVVTTGPYETVRHPMYLAVLIIFLSTPVALGSWWGVIAALPLVAVLVARIRNEERQLVEELEGYREYMQITRYRLIPRVW